MKAQILKIAGVKDEKSFYKKFPSEAAFMKVHGKEFKKAELGMELMKRRDQLPGGSALLSTTPINTKVLDEMPNVGGAMGAMPYIQAGADLAQGIGMIKGQKNALKKAKADATVSNLQLQAARSRDVDFNTMNEQLAIRPEDRNDTGEEFFPINGIGTNVLQGKNGLRIGGEIQNTYAPKNVYQDLGFEPLTDSERSKIFWNGGKLETAENGFMSMLGSNAGMDLMGKATSAFTNKGQGPDAGSMIGGGLGSAVGTAFGGPIGGMIGKGLGSVLGGWIDTSDTKRQKYERSTTANQQAVSIAQMDMSNQFMEDGGNLTNPQVITKFGDIDVSKLHNITHKGMNTLRTGGNLRQNSNYPQDKYALDGLTVYEGKAETISRNPYLPEGGEIVMFKGPKHEDGGMDISYGSQGVEVEGGEPAVKLAEGGSVDPSVTVFGNLRPSKEYLATLGLEELAGQKFKGMVDKISKKTDRLNILKDKSVIALGESPSDTPYQKITDDSHRANAIGVDMQNKANAKTISSLAAIQQAINETADENNLVADDLARGKITKDKSKKITAEDGKEFKTIGKNPGSIDYNPIAPDFNKDYWNSTENYQKNWIPKVESAFADPNQAKDLVARIESYGGQDAEDVKAAIAKGKTPEEKIAIAKRLGTDQKIGPYHKLLSELIAPGLPVIKEDPIIWDEQLKPVKTGEDYKISPILEEVKAKNKIPWMEAVNAAVPYLRPNYQLDKPDLTAEMMAMGFNQQEPVQARTFQPQLDVPYDVSYQDMINKNRGGFRSIERMAQNNPAMLAQLKAQEYGANQQVLGEQFRANQAMKDKVYSKNRDTLNQSQLTNLGIMDKQYERQTSAKAKTQEEAIRIASSMSDKLNKHKLEQHMSDLEQQRYNFRFDSSGRPINMNPLAQFNMEGPTTQPASARGELAPGYEDYYDIHGQRIGTKRASKEDNQVRNGKKIAARNGEIVRALKTI